jgi:MFS family permease
MIGSVSTMAAATIINVAFPALLREFHVGHDSLQWVATGFLAATTSTMLATAWLVESFGQRKTFMVTLAVFLAASLLGAIAWNTGALIAARVLQGAATGIMQPLCMIALFEVFPPHRRGAAMGMFGFGVVLVPAIGPTIGGLLVEAFGWRSIFLMPVPFCVAALALATRFLPGTIRNPRNPFDWTGSALLGAALVGLLNVPVIGHRMGWNSVALAATVAVTVRLAAFVWWEFHARVPLLRAAPVRGARLSFGHARVLCVRCRIVRINVSHSGIRPGYRGVHSDTGRLSAAVAGRVAGNHHRAGGAAHGSRRSAGSSRWGWFFLPCRVSCSCFQTPAPASSCWRFG